jgi:hypothetical protein
MEAYVTYSKAISSFGFAGFAIAFVLYFAFTFGGLLGLTEGMAGQIWLLVLWPTAILMLAAEGSGRFGAPLGFFIGTLSNAAVYAVVGAVLTFVYRSFSHSAGANGTAR